MAGQGDPAARALLYQQFAQKMFSICVRMSGNRSDAEDLLQESFIAAFKNLHQLKTPALFEPWFRSIVVNQCIRHVKKVFPWQQLPEESIASTESETADWLQTISFEEIHREIKKLPSGCREVFNLYVLEDYPHQQIADELGITVSTSKSQYHRARQLLKERLRKHWTQHG